MNKEVLRAKYKEELKFLISNLKLEWYKPVYFHSVVMRTGPLGLHRVGNGKNEDEEESQSNPWIRPYRPASRIAFLVSVMYPSSYTLYTQNFMNK